MMKVGERNMNLQEQIHRMKQMMLIETFDKRILNTGG